LRDCGVIKPSRTHGFDSANLIAQRCARTAIDVAVRDNVGHRKIGGAAGGNLSGQHVDLLGRANITVEHRCAKFTIRLEFF
jgi:hypothetical protein